MKEKVLSLIKSKYADYGPTLVKEKLHEKYSLSLAKETIRQIMIQESFWKAKKENKRKAHLRRTKGEVGPVTLELYETLAGIQHERIKNPFGRVHGAS